MSRPRMREERGQVRIGLLRCTAGVPLAWVALPRQEAAEELTFRLVGKR